METIVQDMRYALRTLGKAPTFTLTAVMTLALAIGANAVVFALVKAVLINPLPYGDPDRLVTVVESDGHTAHADTISAAIVADVRRESHAFEEVALYGDATIRITDAGRPEMIRGMRVSTNFFDTLNVPMYLGQGFAPADDVPGHRVVLTYGLWRERFGADSSIVGRVMPTLDGGYLVIGVTPPDFHPLHMSNPAEVPRVFMPLGFDADRSSCRSAACRGFRAIARLKHGVTAAGARAELDILVREWVHTYPAELAGDESLTITPLRDHVVGRFGSALWMLESAALLLLVLACANSATLLLARTMARQPELAVRVALGADRFRVVRTLLTESLVIAGVASVAGTALAWGATHLITRTADANLPRIAEVSPDRATLLLAIAATAITVVAFGLVPALVASRGLFMGLRAGHGVTPGPTHAKALRAVIAMEVGAAFVLVAVVALLSKSYLHLTRVNPGYDPENLLTVSLLPAGIDQRLAYFDAVAAETRRIPGVHDAAYASTLPLSHPATSSLYVREHPTATDADAAVVDIYLVSPNYLDVMRIPVVRGRTFSPQDTEATERVAVISESTARAQFPGEDPIGQHIKVMGREASTRWAVVVGTVRDVHQYALDDNPDAAVYVLFAQYPMQGYASLVVRSTVPPATLARPLGEAILSVDRSQPVFHLQPMSRYVALSLSQQTFVLRLIAAFGVLALTLAIAGVHGVVSHVVHQRGREIGLRLALGATPTSVQWLILRHVLTTAAAGIAVGFIAVFACRHVLSSLLFNVSPVDVDTTATVAALLIVGAFVAGYAPVARAARVDPAVVLRAE